MWIGWSDLIGIYEEAYSWSIYMTAWVTVLLLLKILGIHRQKSIRSKWLRLTPKIRSGSGHDFVRIRPFSTFLIGHNWFSHISHTNHSSTVISLSAMMSICCQEQIIFYWGISKTIFSRHLLLASFINQVWSLRPLAFVEPLLFKSLIIVCSQLWLSTDYLPMRFQLCTRNLLRFVEFIIMSNHDWSWPKPCSMKN